MEAQRTVPKSSMRLCAAAGVGLRAGGHRRCGEEKNVLCLNGRSMVAGAATYNRAHACLPLSPAAAFDVMLVLLCMAIT